ncbi:MAG: ABC transporter substrate-binding protein [Candidatus Lustribacter sp.]
MLRLATALAIAFAVMLSAPPVGAAGANLTISIPSIDMGDAPYFVAQQKGYFAGEGLHVDFTFAGGGIATPALIAGSIQASASGSAGLSAILHGADLRIVAVFDDSPAYQLWAHDDIRTLEDLKGKAIGIATRGDTFELSTRLMLQNAGFSPDAVAYTPLGFGANAGAAFAGGGLPAVVLSRSEARELQDRGELKNAHLLLDYAGKLKMPMDALAVSQKLLIETPDIARRMLRAIAKGSRYMVANKSQTIAIVAKYQKDPAPSRLAADYDLFLRAFVPTLSITKDVAAKDLAVRATMASVAPAEIPAVERTYDFSLVRSIDTELDASHWKPVP